MILGVVVEVEVEVEVNEGLILTRLLHKSHKHGVRVNISRAYSMSCICICEVGSVGLNTRLSYHRECCTGRATRSTAPYLELSNAFHMRRWKEGRNAIILHEG